MSRLTRVEYIRLYGKDDVKIINTYNAFSKDLTSRHEPGIQDYDIYEKLSRYEDICDDPDKLLLCCNLKALEALKNDSADTTDDTVGADLDCGAEG